jgi:hypothetical protein
MGLPFGVLAFKGSRELANSNEHSFINVCRDMAAPLLIYYVSHRKMEDFHFFYISWLH